MRGALETLAMPGHCGWGRSDDVRLVREGEEPDQRGLDSPISESESLSVVSDSVRPHGLYSLWDSPGQNTGAGNLSLLHGIFPTQGSDPGLLHCRWILYQLSHKESPRILEWVAYPFSSRSL